MRIWIGLLFLAACGNAQNLVRTYVAALEPEAVTLAWGTATGTRLNTIGEGAPGIGEATVRVGNKTHKTDRSWIHIDDLEPDTVYSYSIEIAGTVVASAQFRTWAEKAQSVTFFAMGDFGNGSSEQLLLAQKLEEERQRLETAGQHVRFILSLGDNLYGGGNDRDWDKKFFSAYSQTLSAIPFRPVIGNHDGNESERVVDLLVYHDNFFVKDRWYRFSYGDLVEFFALDSTRNQLKGSPAPVYLAEGDQSKWLEKELEKDPLPWRLAAFHHPMFSAGPRHEPFLTSARHWFDLFQKEGVQVVFSGHEHNLQFSERSEATGGMLFVVSGAAGERRGADVRKYMPANQIAAWSPQYHFLVVQLTPTEMRITPIGLQPIQLRDADGAAVETPIVVQRQVPKQQ